VIGRFTSRTRPACTAQTESASGYGSPWRSAQCAGRRHGLAALQPGDHGLRRSHRHGDPFLRLVGVAARFDDRGDGVLMFQRVMGRDKSPALAPLPQERPAGMYFRLLYLLRRSQGAFAHLTLSETRQHELCLSERWTFAFQQSELMLGSNFSRTVMMLHDEPALRHRAP
jgi:hypothetical protein